MPSRLQRFALPAWLALLVAFAHAPVLRAGFAGADFRVLVSSSGGAPWTRSAAELAAIDGRGSLLGGLSLAASRWVWTRSSAPFPMEAAAWTWRFENLALLCIGALALALFARRLFLPWVGSDQARAAAWTAAALFAAHPLAVHSVAGLAYRGALLGFAFGASAAALFLCGRQDRRPLLSFSAAPFAVLAALSGDGALALPLVVAGAEFASAHRYRPSRERLRTAGTTFLAAGAIVLTGSLVGALLAGYAPSRGIAYALSRFGSQAGLREAAALGVEKLGLLVLPSSAFGLGLGGVALAGALFLAALSPALSAARSAPRLWGWLLFVWFASTGLALLSVAWIRATPSDLSRAGELLAPSALMAVGLGLSSTALSGARRVLLPGALALGYAVIAHANARPFEAAARAAAGLRADVEETRVLYGFEPELLVVDPPLLVKGVGATGAPIGWLLHSGDPESPATADAARASGISERALLALAREREFAELRARPLVVVFPGVFSGGGAVEPQSLLPSGTRASVRVAPPRASTGPRSWRGNSRSPDLDLEAWSVRALRVSAPVGTVTDHPQGVSWRGRESAVREGSHPGAWVSGGAAPVAMFDLGSSLAWCLGDRIQRVWFEGGLPAITLAEVLDRLPTLGGDAGGSARKLEPRVDGGDWVFDRPTALPHEPSGAGAAPGQFVVCLLDLNPATWEYVELPCSAAGPLLRVPDAANRVARAVERAQAAGLEGAVAWSLDYRVGEVTVAHARGRRIGRLGSREENP